MKDFSGISVSIIMVLACCLMPVTLSAMIAEMPVEWYVEKADSIVLGRVIDVELLRKADFEIFTRYGIEVERTLKGIDQPTVSFELFGGELDDQGCWYSDRPYLEQLERVIVFLRNDPENPVVGEMHGKYTIDESAVFIEGLPIPQLIERMRANETNRWEPTGPIWEYTAMTYETNSSYEPGFSEETEWRTSALEWNVTPSPFEFIDLGETSLSGSMFESPYRLDGHNVLYFESIDGQYNVLGQASWAYVPSTNRFVEVDIRFDTDELWWDGEGACPATAFDIQSVGSHELGHALGLAHEVQQTALCPLMKPTMDTCTEYRLCEDDIHGVMALYGIGLLVPSMTPIGIALCTGILAAFMCFRKRH